MPEPRLASSMLVAALRRKVEAAGGFATVLQKGDSVAGAILLLLPQGSAQADASESAEKDSISARIPLLLEREPTLEGPGKWLPIAVQHTEHKEKLEEYLARRCHIDPDLWLIELDTAQAERFAAEIIASA